MELQRTPYSVRWFFIGIQFSPLITRASCTSRPVEIGALQALQRLGTTFHPFFIPRQSPNRKPLI